MRGSILLLCTSLAAAGPAAAQSPFTAALLKELSPRLLEIGKNECNQTIYLAHGTVAVHHHAQEAEGKSRTAAGSFELTFSDVDISAAEVELAALGMTLSPSFSLPGGNYPSGVGSIQVVDVKVGHSAWESTTVHIDYEIVLTGYVDVSQLGYTIYAVGGEPSRDKEVVTPPKLDQSGPALPPACALY